MSAKKSNRHHSGSGHPLLETYFFYAGQAGDHQCQLPPHPPAMLRKNEVMADFPYSQIES
jgi:hypothetical protein